MKKTLFFIILLTSINKVYAQKIDSISIKGQLFSPVTLLSDSNMPERKGVIDIYYKKDASTIKNLNYNNFDKIRVARYYTQTDGTFNIRVPSKTKYYIKFYSDDSDVVERSFNIKRDDIDLGKIVLPEIPVVKGKVCSYSATKEEISTINYYVYINIHANYRKNFLNRNIRYIETITELSLDNGDFEFRLRKGRYYIGFIGDGLIDKHIHIKSKELDLGDVKLGPLIIRIGPPNFKKIIK